MSAILACQECSVNVLKHNKQALYFNPVKQPLAIVIDQQ